MAPPTFLDVNIFMYAAGAPHPYKGPCVHILADDLLLHSTGITLWPSYHEYDST
jgi:hypothetical protein